MLFAEFTKKVIDELEVNRPEEFKDASIELREVYKNGVLFTGVLIRNPNETVVPNIYLDYFFDEDTNEIRGGETVEDVVSTIYSQRKSLANEGDEEFAMVQQWHKVRANVFPYLYDESKKAFDNYISKPFVDGLRVCYQVWFGNEYSYSTTITKELFEMYGISLDVLHEVALANMYHFGYKSESVTKKVKDAYLIQLKCQREFLQEQGLSEDEIDESLRAVKEEIEVLLESEESRMVYVTNDTSFKGANVILDTNFLHSKYEELGEYYILPSSIHECILLKKEGIESEEDVRLMIAEANETAVDEIDFLSNDLFWYNPELRRVEVVR